MRIVLLFAFATLLFAVSSPITSQTIPVKEAKGQWPVQNITPEKAMELALFNAKLDALRQAKVSETLRNFTELIGDDQYLEISDLEIGGDVTEFEILSQDLNTEAHGSFKIIMAEVIINAKVAKYTTSRDPEFQFKVDGIAPVYKENDNLSFTVTPYQNGYLRIFLFEDDGTGSIVYPDEIEPDKLQAENVSISFPLNEEYLYRLTKNDKAKNRENNRMLFVFLKSNIRYTEKEIGLHSVLNWIARIAPDKRTEKFYQFTVTR